MDHLTIVEVGAKVILENNRGLMIVVSLRFEFSTTNNQAQYEVVISRRLLAKGIGKNASS